MKRPLSKTAASLALALAMTGCSADTTSVVDQASELAPEPTTASDPSTTDSPTTGDSNSPSATEGGRTIVVLDRGAEPRFELRTSPTSTSTITVTASETSETVLGDTTQQQSFTGDYDLDLTAETTPSGFTLVTDRTVRILDAAGPAPDVDAIVGFRQGYTPTGLPVFVINEQEDAYRRLSGGLLSTPNLLLAAPTEAVGVGAQWTIPFDQAGDLVAQVTVLAIAESTVEIDLFFDRSTDEGSFSMTAVGTYDRSSLLAHRVTTVSTMTLDTQASENGQLVPLRSQHESVRLYEEVPS